MIQGIGTDIVIVARFTRFLSRTDRILSPEEDVAFKALMNEQARKEYLASRFAAKEAVFKATSALATSALGLSFSMPELSILDDEAGAPHVSWPRFAEQFPSSRLLISLSHESTVAIAFCVVTAEDDKA